MIFRTIWTHWTCRWIILTLKEGNPPVRRGDYKWEKEIPIRDIRRVKCVTNGTISNLCIYTTDKGRFFFDMPKMTVTLNALTVPLLEAVMTRNTGHGIDFSRGDGFGQSTSEFVIIRYLDSGYFLHKDGTAHEDWQKTACDRTAGYGYDLKMLLQE